MVGHAVVERIVEQLNLAGFACQRPVTGQFCLPQEVASLVAPFGTSREPLPFGMWSALER
jgi:hypothetical protein